MFQVRRFAPVEVVAAHEFWKNKNLEQETIQKSDADKWRKILSPGQADMVNFLTRSYAEKFGYDLRYNPIILLLSVQLILLCAEQWNPQSAG